MRLPGLKAAQQSARWVKCRVMGGALILGYHRTGEAGDDPYAINVSARNFGEQLAVLRREANPISLSTLVEGLRKRDLPRRAVVVTFDDGYADTLHYAWPLLEEHDVPATVFVTTGYLGRSFWWDELERIVRSPRGLPDRLCLDNAGRKFEWLAANDPGRQVLLQSLYRYLLPLLAGERDSALRQLREALGAAPSEPPNGRALLAEELQALSSSYLIEIGAHTVTHPSLAALPTAEQQAEIKSSKAYLEHLLGRPVTCFSYPNGSVSTTTRALVRLAGFHCACASFNGSVTLGADPFHLPRFWVPDWSGERFGRWLRRWLHR